MKCPLCGRVKQFELAVEDMRGKDLRFHSCLLVVCICGCEQVIAMDGEVVGNIEEVLT